MQPQPKVQIFDLPVGVHTITLKRGEWIKNPASTKTIILGPGKVTIDKSNHQIRAYIEERCSIASK